MDSKSSNKQRLSSLIYRQNIATKDAEVRPIMVTDFNTSAVKDFYKEFCALDSDDSVMIIPIIVSSYGGSIYALLAMLDIMGSTTKPVATIGLGKAMSCGAVLLSAGTKGYRFAGVGTDILIHEASSVAAGKTSDIKNDVQNTERLNKKLMHLLAKNAGKHNNFFFEMSKKKNNVDLYFTADQAKKLGLIDHVSVPAFLKS